MATQAPNPHRQSRKPSSLLWSTRPSPCSCWVAGLGGPSAKGAGSTCAPGGTSLPMNPSAPSHGLWGQRGWPGLSQPMHDSPGIPHPLSQCSRQEIKTLGPRPQQLQAASFRDPTFEPDLPSKPPQETDAPVWARGMARMGPAAPARLTGGDAGGPELPSCSLFC